MASSSLASLRPAPPLQPSHLPPSPSLLSPLHPASPSMKIRCISRSEIGLISSCMKRTKVRALQARGNNGNTDNNGNSNEEEEEEEDEDSITSEALRATIMKSKKVLAMQKDILQQIVERRKLISTMKDEATQLTDSSDDEFDNISQYKDSTPNFDTKAPVISPAQPPLVPGLFETNTEYNNTNNENTKSYSQKEETVQEKNKNEPPLAGNNVMNIILVSAECAPWSKTGGLGDVAGALPKALARRGHRVMVVAPRYAKYTEARKIGDRKRYTVAGQDMEVAYYHAYVDGVDFVFLDNPIFRHVEKDIYGGDRLEILKRMILLCKAAVEVAWYVPCGGACYGDGNLVFIANDWHTALLPVYLKAYYRDKGFMIYARSVLVIHNIAHQGRGPLDDFRLVDLPHEYMEMFKMYDPLGGDHFNIFAAGIKAADRILTVSHGYAWELKTSEGGWGLHSIINDNDWKFQGIVNGVDINDWNPKLDMHLKTDGYTNYSLETLQNGKAQCKAALQRELGLPVNENIPMIGFIGRLDHQKGVDLIADAMAWIVSQDVQIVMLGSGRADLEDMLRRMESQHHDRVRSWVGFSVKMAHRITAGCDILLMPSRFEPCGLNQLYAMMYGTVPVVHSVGGLRDTVEQYNPYAETGFGWTFDKADAGRMIDALGHCLNTYRNYRKSWDGLRRRGMMRDLSWDNAAKSYEDVLVTAKYQW